MANLKFNVSRRGSAVKIGCKAELPSMREMLADLDMPIKAKITTRDGRHLTVTIDSLRKVILDSLVIKLQAPARAEFCPTVPGAKITPSNANRFEDDPEEENEEDLELVRESDLEAV